MYVKFGETIRGTFGTANFGTGAAQNADALPVCTVIDQGAPMGYVPVVTLQAVGLYEVALVLTAPNGFLAARSYSSYATVIVGGVTARAPVAGITSFNTLTTNTDDIANAVLDALLTGHAVVGSVADGIAIAAGLLQGNFYMDQTNNTDPNGQTQARLRVFRTGAATALATDGGSGQGEFATFIVTTTYIGPNKIATHRAVRQ